MSWVAGMAIFDAWVSRIPYKFLLMSTLLSWIQRPAFECLNEVQRVGDSKNAGNNQILLY